MIPGISHRQCLFIESLLLSITRKYSVVNLARTHCITTGVEFRMHLIKLVKFGCHLTV